MAIHDEYSTNPDQNQLAPPQGAPEGNFKGSDVNNILRRVMAAIKELANGALRVPLTFPAAAQAGNMAMQNKDAVDITGGRINYRVAGVMPIGTIVFAWGTPSVIAEWEPYWSLCDGRTVNGITTPNLVATQAYIRFGAPLGEQGGSYSGTTTQAGLHNHGAFVTETALSAANLPGLSITAGQRGFSGDGNRQAYGPVGGEGTTAVSIFSVGNSTPHNHQIFTDGIHEHHFTIAPPYIIMLPVMRTL